MRVISHTGYRWSFPLEEARGYLLATHVGDEPISHGHGAPVRLVAPGRRGFQWVKWVVRLELSDEPDAGALASTVWSSFTPEATRPGAQAVLASTNCTDEALGRARARRAVPEADQRGARPASLRADCWLRAGSA